MRPTLFLSAIGLLLLSLVCGVHFYSQHMLRQQVRKATARQELLPKCVLWVWERPEDLREIDPASTGVAVLQETLHLGSSLMPDLRHQPVLMPEGIPEIAVVRIETDQNFATHKRDSALLQNVVANLEGISRQPGISALQIDFDAKKSERAFYSELLRNVRQRMPPTLPLDITALVSWCSTDAWISDLPINAATPMFFRMEPDRRRMPLEQAPGYQVHEPLCLGSVGVSTAEPWPHDIAGKRVFLFADHGWANDRDRLPTRVFNQTAFHSERP